MERFNSYRDPLDKLVRCTECGQSLELCQCDDYSMMAHDRLNSPESELLNSALRTLEQLRLETPESFNVLPQMTEILGSICFELNQNLRGEQPNLGTLHYKLSVLMALSLRLWTEGDPTAQLFPHT